MCVFLEHFILALSPEVVRRRDIWLSLNRPDKMCCTTDKTCNSREKTKVHHLLLLKLKTCSLKAPAWHNTVAQKHVACIKFVDFYFFFADSWWLYFPLGVFQLKKWPNSLIEHCCDPHELNFS